jgi:hypothetical protein
MQIALTKKLSQALKLKPPQIDDTINPLFTWTANWTTVWTNRKSEDMLVLVNNATRFTVAVYQVKRKDLKNLEEKMTSAIRNTLLFHNFNEEMVDAYMKMAGKVSFVRNSSRQMASWVSKAGLECAFHVGREYNGISKMYCDTLGAGSNHRIVNCSDKDSDSYYPYRAMRDALASLTGIQAYKSRVFELLISLDLGKYQAKRRLLVPAHIDFDYLHKILQTVFNWKNNHLYDFTVYDKDMQKVVLRFVPFFEDLEYDENAMFMREHTLSEIFPEHKKIFYTYDMGDNWEHEIEFIREFEDYDSEVPYLLEATGQTPPEDIGGVAEFVRFNEIMQNPDHPAYEEMKTWAGYWHPELSEWQRRPRVIYSM